MNTVLAVDIGGTKLAAGLVEAEGGRILDRAARPTPRTDDPELVFAAWSGWSTGCGPGRAAPRCAGSGPAGP